MAKPYLLVDIDGVVSLFGPEGPLAAAPAGTGAGATAGAPGSPSDRIQGSFHAIDGIPHFLSSTAAAHLLSLTGAFELVWASGWEEKAEEYLPHLLGLPAGLPYIAFSQLASATTRTTSAHWKLDAIEAFVGERALAWVDDAFNPSCHEWAAARGAPTLLVSTTPQRGLTREEAVTLLGWAKALAASR
jgi:hypothetical protein